MSRRTRALPGVIALAGALMVSACNSSSSTDVDPARVGSSTAPTSDVLPVIPASYNPCTKLDVAPVIAQLGHRVVKDLGTSKQIRCALKPTTPGDPVLTVTYQPYNLDLNNILIGMGEQPDSVVQPRIPHADEARLLIALDPTRAFTTGFIKIGGLVEVVNGADPPPYDIVALVHATEQVMKQLAATAPAMAMSSSTPSSSPLAP